MPAPLMPKEQVLDRLMDAFRDKGYEGASLSELSAATGLTKNRASTIISPAERRRWATRCWRISTISLPRAC